ncbi:Peroxisomal membrane signal receptor PTS1 [Coelomomyces lativittatus]|nr:Peroxisomal membrane signal receptor PTS1 [Coelomomyces lativittatus]
MCTILGIKQQENEKEQQAITALRQALKLDPGQLNAWLALAVSYTNENRSECATDSLKGWLLNHPQYHTVLPTSSSMTPSSAVLADYFLKAVHVATHVDPDLQVGLGVLFNLTENYERAVDCFQVALACRPYDAFLWNKLGATLANSNQSEKAIDAYFRALQINPNYIRARYNLGIACIHLKQHKEAVHQLLQALQFQQQRSAKGSPHIWDSLKMACLLLQKFDWAQLCDVTDLKELQAAVLRG